MTIKITKISALLALVLLAATARAETQADPLKQILGQNAPPKLAAAPLAGEADDALHLTMNKDELIRLEQDAASVIVNNPDHVQITLDSPRLLIAMPRLPGATSFTVLNAKGEVIVKRDVIVTGTEPGHVRVRRVCQGSDPGCVPSSYFYCPDGCYEVSPVSTANQGGSVPEPTALPGSRTRLPSELPGTQSGAAGEEENVPPAHLDPQNDNNPQ